METMTMIFRCAGLDSEEEFEVRESTETTVTLDTAEDINECKVFSLKTGKCLNDETTFGCSRRLKITSHP